MSKSYPSLEVPEAYIPMVDKAVDAAWPKISKTQDFALTKGKSSFTFYLKLLYSAVNIN